jgi:probable HAF family extracellular repeat protein
MPIGAQVRAVSPDATVLILDDGQRGFRWAHGQSVDLGVIEHSLYTFPVATSRAGVVVVGQTNGGISQGFRWQDGRIEGLGDVYPTDISTDGTVLAGYHLDRAAGGNVAFRLVGGVLVDLGFLRPDTHSEAWGLSADGSTVIGYGQYRLTSGAVVNEAFRWRDGVMAGLGGLRPGDDFYSVAADVSADGAVVAGTTRGQRDLEAFRWEQGVMTGLGVLDGYAESIGQVVSGDGTTVFGRCQRMDVHHDGPAEEVFTAFVWDRANGMRELGAVLAADFGLDVAGWSLEEVLGASGDGRTLIGSGTNPSGARSSWLARLGPPPR